MPPASRGSPNSSPFTFITLLRRTYATSSHSTGAWKQTAKNEYRNARKIRPKQYKSSPIEGRAKQHTQDAPKNEFESKSHAELEADERAYSRRFWRRWVGNVIIAAPIIGFLMMHRPFDLMSVTGGSMRPLFNGGVEDGDDYATRDKMLVGMWGHYKKGDIERGEIVVFKTPHDPEKIAVKRVVALAGDKVLPLPGWEGSEEEQNDGVVVPYNHMWVEGDVDDRGKSVDSNWYGPISQNLVVGRAKAVLTPWWKPRWIRTSDFFWPAEEKRRVGHNVVQDAARNPDKVGGEKMFEEGHAEEVLAMWRTNRDSLVRQVAADESRDRVVAVYEIVKAEVKKQDPETREVAEEMGREIESAFYRAGGHIEFPLFPEMKLIVAQEMAQERKKEKEARQGPASNLLEELQRQGKELEEATERAKAELRRKAREVEA